MARTIAYWGSTGLIALGALFAAFTYLTGSPEAVQGFQKVGYPQQLRVLLGIAKVLGAASLLAPGFPILKEWTYAGFTFTWIAATIAHSLASDGGAPFPIILLVLLGVSYVTRPANRRLPTAYTV
jgi:hypothetical protein